MYNINGRRIDTLLLLQCQTVRHKHTRVAIASKTYQKFMDLVLIEPHRLLARILQVLIEIMIYYFLFSRKNIKKFK